MKISQAAELIRTPMIEWKSPQSWCDLGSRTDGAAHMNDLRRNEIDRRFSELLGTVFEAKEEPIDPK
jgi:hypothetical protein